MNGEHFFKKYEMIIKYLITLGVNQGHQLHQIVKQMAGK